MLPNRFEDAELAGVFWGGSAEGPPNDLFPGIEADDCFPGSHLSALNVRNVARSGSSDAGG